MVCYRMQPKDVEVMAQCSRVLYASLMQLMTGKAMTIMHQVKTGNGMEAYRRLSVKFDTDTRFTKAARVDQINLWDFSRGTDIIENIEKFEIVCSDVVLETGYEMQDEIKVSKLRLALQPELRQIMEYKTKEQKQL